MAGLAYSARDRKTASPVDERVYLHSSHVLHRLYQLTVYRERRVLWRDSFIAAWLASLALVLLMGRFDNRSFLATLCATFALLEIPRRQYAAHQVARWGLAASHLYSVAMSRSIENEKREAKAEILDAPSRE